MRPAALAYAAERFPVFPNLVGGVVLFASPAALGVAAAADAPGAATLALALLLFVAGLFAMRVADDLIDARADAAAAGTAPEAAAARRRAMAGLGAAAALLILAGSLAVRGGWLMALFLAWLGLVSLTLNRRASADAALLWLANEPMYLLLLAFAYAAASGALPATASGLGAVAGNWLMIESWEVGRKCFAAPGPRAEQDVYSRRLGRRGARTLFFVFYGGGAALLAGAGAALGLGPAAAWGIAAAAILLLLVLRRKPVAAALAFFLAANLALAAGALIVRFGG